MKKDDKKVFYSDQYGWSFPGKYILLAIPAISGAGLLMALDSQSDFTIIPFSSLVVAFLSSFVVGYVCLKWLLNLLESGKFYFFGYYCFVIGLTVLVFF